MSQRDDDPTEQAICRHSERVFEILEDAGTPEAIIDQVCQIVELLSGQVSEDCSECLDRAAAEMVNGWQIFNEKNQKEKR